MAIALDQDLNPPATRQRAAKSPKAGSEAELRRELELYKRWFGVIAQVCEGAAAGNLEGRVLRCDQAGEIGRTAQAVNHLLDVTETFIRDTKATLEYAETEGFSVRYC